MFRKHRSFRKELFHIKLANQQIHKEQLVYVYFKLQASSYFLVTLSMMKILSTITQEQVSEGPVPWVSKSSVTFVAEQVSHHPPSKLTITLLKELVLGRSKSKVSFWFKFSI